MPSFRSYATLESFGSSGCQVGDQTFRDFVFSSSATGIASVPEAADITFHFAPAATGTCGLNFGGFVLDATANAVTFISGAELTLRFDIAVATGGQPIDGSELDVLGSAANNASAVVNETLCVGQSYMSTCAHPIPLDTPARGSNMVSFTPSTLVGVDATADVSAFMPVALVASRA